MSKIILTRPAFRTKGISSTFLSASHINEIDGFKVIEFNNLKDIFKRYNYVHLHWPDTILSHNGIWFEIRFLIFKFLIFFFVILKKKIIWTTHNIQSHNTKNKLNEKRFWKFFLDKISYAIYPLPALKEAHINNNQFKKMIIPFGPYKRLTKNKSVVNSIKSEINYDPKKKYFLCFGYLRPYKGYETLIDLFDKMDSNYQLLIYGKPYDKKYAERLKPNNNVKIIKRFINDNEFPALFEISEASILNYTHISNSGSIRLALTYDQPIILPYFKQFSFFHNSLDTDLVLFFKNQKQLLNHIYEINKNKFINKKVNWKNCDWEQYKEKFQKLLES